jgi:hypothetical protein
MSEGKNFNLTNFDPKKKLKSENNSNEIFNLSGV